MRFYHSIYFTCPVMHYLFRCLCRFVYHTFALLGFFSFSVSHLHLWHGSLGSFHLSLSLFLSILSPLSSSHGLALPCLSFPSHTLRGLDTHTPQTGLPACCHTCHHLCTPYPAPITHVTTHTPGPACLCHTHGKICMAATLHFPMPPARRALPQDTLSITYSPSLPHTHSYKHIPHALTWIT